PDSVRRADRRCCSSDSAAVPVMLGTRTVSASRFTASVSSMASRTLVSTSRMRTPSHAGYARVEPRFGAGGGHVGSPWREPVPGVVARQGCENCRELDRVGHGGAVGGVGGAAAVGVRAGVAL